MAAIASIGFAIPIVMTYLETGLVPRLPTAVLATGLMLSAFLCMAAGLILDTVTRGRREMKLLAYLSTARQARSAARLEFSVGIQLMASFPCAPTGYDHDNIC
jgi:hypothetical protein